VKKNSENEVFIMQNNNIIKKTLLNFKGNELIFANTLYKTQLYNYVNEAAFYKTLERMCKSGELVKIAKGTYHLPKVSKYGIVPPTDKEIITSFTKNNTGTVIGYSLYNALNLTTQVAKSIEVMSATIESFSKTIRNVIVHKVQIDYNENVKNIIHGLEVLQNYYNIQDINNLSFINFTKKLADLYEEEAFKKVISAINYKKSTIAFLREILNFYGVKNNLNMYLSSMSEYKYPKMEEIYEITRV
jgi:hypothetical protein